MKTILIFLFAFFSFSWAGAQVSGNFWNETDESEIVLPQESEVQISASAYRTMSLDLKAISNVLATAPMEFTAGAKNNPLVISLPMPDGSWETFRVVESPVMEPELVAAYPSIKSFKGYGITHSRSTTRFDVTPKGFHALIRSPKGEVYIDPYATEQTDYYISYFTRDVQIGEEMLPALRCGYDPAESPSISEDIEFEEDYSLEKNQDLLPLRIYRFALSCTGEYGSTHGGTTEAVFSTFTTAVNRLNAILEAETAVRLLMIPATPFLIFTDPNDDPYFNAANGTGLLDQNQDYFDSFLTDANYDLGHIFTNGCFDVGGVAGGSACGSGKARGVTCHSSSNVLAVVNRIMAHEIGHQLSAGHSWNNCPNALEQLASGSAMEPGSGSTIMSYAGACGDQNIQFGNDTYYNIASLEQIIFFSRIGGGSQCGVSSITDNTQPEVFLDYQNGFYIPVSTPFELTASAFDADGDPLTYCWEQHDLGPVSTLGEPTGTAPIFRSFPPTDNPTRVFPRMATIVNNQEDVTEWLPTYTRDLSFTCTVRDNNPEISATVWAEVKFKATDSAGPFLVTHPNTGEEKWKVGDYVEINWDVANTDNPLVNCKYVNIKLSTDGGFTYPYTLIESTPNDGSAFVFVPDAVGNKARIRVEAADNIFFDISDFDFEIEPAAEPGFAIDVLPAGIAMHCLPSPVQFGIQTNSFLGFDSPLTLHLLGDLPEQASYSFSQNPVSPPQSSTLTIDMGGFVKDRFDLILMAVTPGFDTVYRELTFTTFTQDFSDLELAEPFNGQSNIQFTTPFSWTASADAITYDFELATNPAFGSSTLQSGQNLTEPSFTHSGLLEENTLYYWRVRAVNECGPGDWLEPFIFQTVITDCAPYLAGDTPVNISGTGTPTVESTIFVPTEGIISDLNVPLIWGNYQPVNSLRLTLISPAGTEVVLFDQNCGNTLNMRIGFDDEAPSAIICPPSTGIVYQPVQPLSAFDGENTFGTWKLRVKVVEMGFGASGAIDTWGLEFCASRTPNNPFVITNDTLSVPPGQGNLITNQTLEVQDEDNTPDELRYTIVTPPVYGTLVFQGQALGTGDFFRQSTIDAFNLAYVHNGDDAPFDGFTFVVEDGEGGFIPIQRFNIKVDENAVVGTTEPVSANDMRLFRIRPETSSTSPSPTAAPTRTPQGIRPPGPGSDEPDIRTH
jgi:hypothetical protein